MSRIINGLGDKHSVLCLDDAELKWLRLRLAGAMPSDVDPTPAEKAEARRILRILVKIHWMAENYSTDEALEMLREMRSGRGYDKEITSKRGPKGRGFGRRTHPNAPLPESVR